MSNSELSLIVPVYNAEKYVNDFIKNVECAKGNIPLELLFIDDGSTDATVQLVKTAQSNYPYIQLFCQKHQYQAKARNLGIQHATGNYMMFIDVDDSFDASFFSKMLSKAEGKKLVISGICHEVNGNKVDMSQSVLEGVNSQKELVENFLTKRDHNDSGIWNKLFLTDVIKNHHIIFDNNNFLEDTLFCFKYLNAINYDQISFIHQPLYTYKRHSGATTTVLNPKMDQMAWQFVQKVSSILKNNQLYDSQLVDATRIRTFVYVINRHILDDCEWARHKQQKLATESLNGFMSNRFISSKYKLGIVLIKWFPSIYYHLYKHFKENN